MDLAPGQEMKALKLASHSYDGWPVCRYYNGSDACTVEQFMYSQSEQCI